MTENGDAPTLFSRARAEIRATGTLGLAGYSVLCEQMDYSLRLFPTLTEEMSWSIEDAAHEFWADKGQNFLDDVTYKGIDADGFRPLLRRFLKYWLIDRVRQTDRGSVRNRLERRMTATPERFKQSFAEHWWQVLAPPDDAWDGDGARVLTAMRAVPIAPPLNGGNDEVRQPIARAADLVAVLVAMFTAAAGSMHISAITTLVMSRFTHTFTPVVDLEEAASEDTTYPSTEQAAVVLADAANVADAAQAVLASLDPRDREALPLMEDIPALCDHWQVDRSVAYRRRAKVYRQIQARCREYGDHWMLGRIILDLAEVTNPGERNAADLVRVGEPEGHVESGEGLS